MNLKFNQHSGLSPIAQALLATSRQAYAKEIPTHGGVTTVPDEYGENRNLLGIGADYFWETVPGEPR